MNKKHITTLTVLLIYVIILSFSADTSTDAAPISEKSTNIGKVELISTTQQGITLQLTIPESVFEIETLERDGKHFQTLSFPGCRYINELGLPRLPIQTALLGVPSDVSFTARIVESSVFSTYKLQHTLADKNVVLGRHNSNGIVLNPESKSNSSHTTNRYFPQSLVKIGEAGWIRENRVLPIQLNPVQYNPVSGVVKLYHQLVVEVQFDRLGNAPPALQGFSRQESSVYEEMFGNLLTNPQTAKQWRSTDYNASPRENSSRNGTVEHISPFSIPSAPAVTTPRYKIYILNSGMYHITASDLAAAGVDITTIKPSTLSLSNKGKQIPIFVRNAANGKTVDDTSGFDSDGEIIFYAQRHSGEKTYFDPYTDQNVYWLSWNAGPGLRMETTLISTEIPEPTLDTSGFPIEGPTLYQPRNFLTRVHVERDNQFRRFKNFGLEANSEFDVFGDGILQRDFGIDALPDLPDDSWFWAQTSATEIRNFPFMITGVAGTGQKATMRVALHGRSEGSHFTEMWLNNDIVLGRPRWTGDTEYQFVNQQISQSALKNGRNTLSAVSPEDHVLDLVLMNWFEVDYWRTFEANSNVLPFSITLLPDDVTGEVNTNFRVTLKNFTDPSIEIYGVDGTRYVGLAPKEDEDIPGIYEVIFQSTRIGGVPQFRLGESLNLDTSIQYIALTRGKYRKPQKIIKDTSSDLRSQHNGADYIIITHTDFMRDVQPLADFRSEQGLRTKVVDVQDIYDEFNHGLINPYALRDFLKYTYENWQSPAPTYVLLVGDANPIDKTSFVPTIQVQIPGYGSSSSDHQFVTFRGDDSFPDMLIGRVPVSNSVDARIFVERAINYESTDKIGPWHKRILMLAGSTEDFHTQTDSLVKNSKLTPKYETKLIYAPTTVEDDLPLGEGTTPVGRQVIDGFNNGASIVNYVGHGAGGRWASSRMMDLEDPHKNLTNISQLPFVISMTCFTGEFDSKTGCLAEEFLRSESGGAIGVIGGTSVGLLWEDHILNREIFKAIFNDKTPYLGAILAEAKTQFLLNLPGYLDLAEVFTLFGDPATRLRLPHTQMQLQVETDKVLHRDVFNAGTLLSVSGTLPNPNFSGDVEITVLPKPVDRESKRNRATFDSSHIDPRRVMDVTPRMETVQVMDGQFKAEVQIPYNSAFDAWDLRTYAWNTEEDAIGYTAYTTLNQYINNVRLEPFPVPSDQPVHVYVDVANVSPIEDITLYWSQYLIESRRDEADPIPLVLHEGTTYRTEQPIPAHISGILIDYYLLVKTKEGRILQTEVVTYTVGEAADLTVLENTISWDTDAPYHLSAHIKNLGSINAKNIPVRFFQMPATADSEAQEVTLEMLQNATPIGNVKILPEILVDGFVVASVPWQPDPGTYLVTVYVDLPSEQQPDGIIPERRETNNSGSQVFVNNRVFIATENIDKPIQSLDGMFRITFPPRSLQTHNAITFEAEPLTIKNQPDIAHVPITSEDGYPTAYRLEFSQQTELIATATFVKTTSDDFYIYMLDDETGNWIRIGKQIDDGETISAEVKLPGAFALLSHTDSKPPSVEVNVEDQGFIDGDYISEIPIITAKIEDANGIDPRPESIILTKNGNRVPQDEYTISASPASSNIILITYSPINALEAGEYRIRLQAQDANGNVEDSTLTAKVAGGFEIKNIANFPNPFRPGQGASKGTDFAYYLTGGADKVSLKIYTLTGKLITTIDTLDASISYNEYHFDGLDADGDPLANGVYIYKFTATRGDTRAQKVGKIVVLK